MSEINPRLLSLPPLYARAVAAIGIGTGGLMHLIGVILALLAGRSMPAWFYAVFFFAIPAYLIAPFLIYKNARAGYFIALFCPLIGGLMILGGFLFPDSRLLVLIPGTFDGEITLIGFITLITEPVASSAALLLVVGRSWAEEDKEVGEQPAASRNPESVVATVTDHEGDKYSILEKVLAASGFFEVLDEAWKKSGKAKADFKIAVKPSLSMMLRRSDVGTYTDPFLVIHLLRLMAQRGYSNLAVVESGNLYGNWFENRAVAQVAAREGYLDESVVNSYRPGREYSFRVWGGGADASARVVDLGEDRVDYNFGGTDGVVELGRAWVEADFRINFAKQKSHFYSLYTSAIKNVYGCLPEQDKVIHYHCRRKVGPWTALLIHTFPVHFSIVDAYSSADGWMGVKIQAIARKPHTIFGGADLMAVDHFGASLLKIDARKGVMLKCLEKLQPLEDYKVAGESSPFSPWRNSPSYLALFSWILEGNANVMDWAGAISTGGHDDCFPHKPSNLSLIKRLTFAFTAPANLALDLTGIKLKIRELRFRKSIRSQATRLPLIAGSDFILDRITLLAAEDISRLADLLGEGIEGGVDRSGHYLFIGGREVTFPSRLTPACLAALEIVQHAVETGLDSAALALELKVLAEAYPVLFGKAGPYSYCYE